MGLVVLRVSLVGSHRCRLATVALAYKMVNMGGVFDGFFACPFD
jgi:hypothetical protein